MRDLCLALALAAPALASSQAPAPVAELRVRVTNPEHAPVAGSGVLPFDRQGLVATVSVVAVDANGRPTRAGAVRWTTSDENVVTLYDDPAGASVRVVAQQDGRAALTVTASGKTATLPVIVGKARREIAASELAPAFRVARLEIVAERGNAGPNAEAVSGGLRLKENGHGALLKARAVAADGTPIPLEFFPVAWATADERVVELSQTEAAQTQVVAREPGRTTLGASIQGVTATVNAEVVAASADVGALEGTRVVATATGATATGAAATVRESPASIAAPVVKGEISAAPSGATPTSGANTATTSATRVTSAPTGERTAADPAAVHATGFAAIGGYGNVQLEWVAAPGAAGYRIARTGWDAATQRFLPEYDAIFPTPTSGPTSDKDLVLGTIFTDVDVRPGRQYVYSLSTYYKGSDGSYYFADAATSPKVTAVPKDPVSLAWLPPAADRKVPPALEALTIGAERRDTTGVDRFTKQPTLSDAYWPVTIRWVPKSGAIGYVLYYDRITYPTDHCEPYVARHASYWGVDFVPQREALIAGTTAHYKIGRANESLMCFAVFAIYPEKLDNGTPTTAYFWSLGPQQLIERWVLYSTIHSDALFVAVKRDGPRYVRAYPRFEGAYPGATVP